MIAFRFPRAFASLASFAFGLALCTALIVGLGPRDARAAPLDAVIGVRAEVPDDARTARVLGTQRAGSGIVIGDDGLVLTIGYLIMEAISAELVLPEGKTVPADVVAYDYETGFGLVRALAPPANWVARPRSWSRPRPRAARKR